LIAAVLCGAAPETGLPFISNFSARDYRASNQNWSIAQHPNGFIYIANSKGVLEFDGSQWRLIPLTNNAAALSVATTQDGTIFVGGKREFGYLSADSTGTLVYFSLLDHLSLLDRDFGDVWETIPMDHRVYFRSEERLFCLSVNDSTWSEPIIKSWAPKNEFHFSFNVDGLLLVRDDGYGLFYMENQALVPLAGSEIFADERIYGFLAMPDSAALVVSRTNGFFHYKNDVFAPIHYPAESFIKQHRAIHTIRLQNGDLAMATNAGVLFVNAEGEILHLVDKKSGLLGDMVWFLMQDKQGGVWAALNNGISRIELPSPLTLFDERTKLEGTVQDIIRHKNRIYVATSPAGVSYLDADPQNDSPFAQFKQLDIPYQSWQFATLDDKLLVAATTGVYEIIGNRVQHILPNRDDIEAACLFAPADHSKRVFVGLFDGVGSLKLQGNRWIWEGRIEEIADEIRSITQDKSRTLWLGTRSNGLYRLQYSDSTRFVVTNLEHYSSNEGLPAGQIFPFMVGDRLVITTENRGLYSFDAASNSFLPELSFGPQFSDGTIDVEVIAQKDSGTTVWFGSEEAGRIDQVSENNGRYEIEANALQRLPESAIRAIYPDENNVLWISTNDGLFRFDAGIEKNIQSDYKAFVRKVVILPDSLLFGGASSFEQPRPILESDLHSLRFEFSAVSYDARDAIQFQTFLQGFDKSWSTWSLINSKEYTNLPHGDYTFKVRAFDIYGRISQEAAYEFRILPPFYRTWIAYLFYAIMFAAIAFTVDRLQRRRLSKRAQERTRVALLEAENKRKSEELEQARNLQISMLPKQLPQVDDLTIGVFMKTATEVGGDYYDFIVKDGEFTGAIGDATGHGLNAGMMVSIIKGFFVSEAANMGIVDFFHKCNRALKRMHLKNIYMGMTVFKIKNKMLSISSAGMPPTYHYKAATNVLEEFVLPGMPLGALRDFNYLCKDVELFSGDVLFFMSDGFPELFNPDDEMIGFDRVPDILKKLAHKPPNDIIIELVEHSKKWAEGRPNEDDMTFVILKVN
jgi:serine phosphatase RsbU (regulator of sigma subunit)